MIYDSDYTVKTPSGLTSTEHNDCWFSTIIQLMFSMPALNQTLLHNADEWAENAFVVEYLILYHAGGGDLTQLIAAMYDILAQVDHIDVKIAAADFVKHRGKQQCPAVALDMILFTVIGGQLMYDLFNISYTTIFTCPNCANTRQHADIAGIFPLHVGVDAICTEQQFVDSAFLRAASISGEHLCDKCFTEPMWTSVNVVTRCGQIIIMRFPSMKKGDLGRYHPDEMRIRQKTDNKIVLYDLIGVNECLGIDDAGHHIARILRDDLWYTANGSKITPYDYDPMVSSYLVVYHRR